MAHLISVGIEENLYDRLEDMAEALEGEAPVTVEGLVHIAVEALLEGAGA